MLTTHRSPRLDNQDGIPTSASSAADNVYLGYPKPPRLRRQMPLSTEIAPRSAAVLRSPPGVRRHLYGGLLTMHAPRTYNRRSFLKTSTATLAAAPFAFPSSLSAQVVDGLADDPTLNTLVPTAIGGPAPQGADTLTLRWLGCANHEIAFRDQVILLDAWYDRGPRNRPLGFGPDDVQRADVIINGHAHFDHIADIPGIARRTGATVLGAPLSTEYARSEGLSDGQVLATAGGEHLEFNGFTVDAILAHHSLLPREVLDKLAPALAADMSPLSEQEQQQQAEIRARGLSDPRIITEGTIAYLFTFDNGFRLLYRNSAGPITDPERQAATDLGGVDLAIIAYQGHPVAESQIAVTLPLVQLYQPGIYLPTHHDTIAGTFTDIATEPLFMAIRDALPETRSISPLYRTPVVVDMQSGTFMVGV
jgi:Beta-lactamase superfamily domain